jgi:hypothetical protein
LTKLFNVEYITHILYLTLVCTNVLLDETSKCLIEIMDIITINYNQLHYNKSSLVIFRGILVSLFVFAQCYNLCTHYTCLSHMANERLHAFEYLNVSQQPTL